MELGRIEFRDVSFAYPAADRIGDDETTSTAAPLPGQGGEDSAAVNRNVLEHISFTVEPGETVGILGATG